MRAERVLPPERWARLRREVQPQAPPLRAQRAQAPGPQPAPAACPPRVSQGVSRQPVLREPAPRQRRRPPRAL
ncbi:hypothetical protein ABB31_13695 [Stenotrophomonas pavanii]|nr:hypothetical protein ABB31_13695 [Stenotrophomonas pavanii]